MATIPEYDAQMVRARRNFALCVIMIQGPRDGILFTAVEVEWRAKANKLQLTIITAECAAEIGCYDFAHDLLKKENEPT